MPGAPVPEWHRCVWFFLMDGRSVHLVDLAEQKMFDMIDHVISILECATENATDTVKSFSSCICNCALVDSSALGVDRKDVASLVSAQLPVGNADTMILTRTDLSGKVQLECNRRAGKEAPTGCVISLFAAVIVSDRNDLFIFIEDIDNLEGVLPFKELLEQGPDNFGRKLDEGSVAHHAGAGIPFLRVAQIMCCQWGWS